MTRLAPTLSRLALLGLGCVLPCLAGDQAPEQSMLRFKVQTLAGKERDLSVYRGKVLLVVNTASRCGYTKHYAGLQKLHTTYAKRGLIVAGFSCNQFGGQEPGSAAEIQTFCKDRFGVEFPLFAKVEVLPGEGQAPLFKALTSEGPEATRGPIQWNFEKFLIGPDGKLLARWRSQTAPEDPKLLEALEAALARVTPEDAARDPHAEPAPRQE